MNITDGRFVYMRNPVQSGCGPLYAYTAMPTGGLNRWYPREVHEKIEMGRYFGHTYNLPLYRIPVTGGVPKHHSGEPSYVNRHLLFDLESDPQQLAPLADPAQEAHFIERMRAHLAACEAPQEQYARLGI